MKPFKAYLFPTVVEGFDDLLNEKEIDVMKKDIIKSSNNVPNWQSNPKLHKNAKYKPLVDKIYELTKKVFDDYQYIYDKFEITDMWSNILKPGESTHTHTHPNNLLSGVFYTDTSNVNIQFLDPRVQARVLIPEVKSYMIENSQVWFFPSIKNRLLLFPSYLEHYVPVNDTNENRISISFNIMLRGNVGISKEYKSARF